MPKCSASTEAGADSPNRSIPTIAQRHRRGLATPWSARLDGDPLPNARRDDDPDSSRLAPESDPYWVPIPRGPDALTPQRLRRLDHELDLRPGRHQDKVGCVVELSTQSADGGIERCLGAIDAGKPCRVSNRARPRSVERCEPGTPPSRASQGRRTSKFGIGEAPAPCSTA